MLLLIAMLCQELNPYPPRPDLPSPHGVIDSTAVNGPVAFNIDWSVASLAETPQTQSAPKVVMYSPSWCGTCPGWAAYLGDLVEVRKVSQLPAGQGTAPALQRADGAFWSWGVAPTRETLALWAGDGVVAEPQGPLMAGSASLGDIGKYLDLITTGTLSGTLPHEPIEIGSGATVNLNSSSWSLVVNGKSKSVTFAKPEPSVQYGFAKASLTGVDYDGSSVTLRIRGLPDWKFKVN